ncbi:MAG: glycoside hydrolase family 92 protein [Bacteroidetes bacterium]|nr:MAG: glycoside hydrolase family 92 protein [Bacteroidota bacterium]
MNIPDIKFPNLLIIFLLLACKSNDTQLSSFVNPLIGTESSFSLSNGNTYPSVSMPFGMTAWTPQTAEKGWIYTYQAEKLQGLRATHQPSPWMGDYGQFTLMPMLAPLRIADKERAARFSHESEIARPHYYSVLLEESGIKAEMTPSMRCAIMRFTFPKSKDAFILLDASDAQAKVSISPETQSISGYTTANSGGVPDNFACYFVLTFDTPFEVFGTFEGSATEAGQKSRNGEDIGAYVKFSTKKEQEIEVKIGTSFISIEQAQHNLKTETEGKDFDQLMQQAQEVWDRELGRIEIEGATEAQRITFYTALYRSMLFPHSFHETDADGKMIHYSPYNGQVEQGEMYVDNGFWDTFRAVYPLYSILIPEQHAAILRGLINTYEEGDWLPKWTSPGYRNVMIGTHTASLFAGAYSRGIRDFDAELAYEAMVKDALSPPAPRGPGRMGNPYYTRLGYVPSDKLGEATARTLEYAYGDFCVGQMAKQLGQENDYLYFSHTAYNYEKVYDPQVGFMRGREESGRWRPNFSPIEWGGPFTEGSAWHYTWSVMHDPAGLISLMGGDEAFVKKLDQLFEAPPEFEVGTYGREIHEMTEMVLGGMGQYAHGNQPVHHVPYLYNFAGQPWKTQQRVRAIMDQLYGPGPDGLCGDEDNGQMSAWYIFSALGFYPVCPAKPQYVLGTPLFKKATVHLPNGKTFVVEAPNNSEENPYVQSVLLNGAPYEKNWISHEHILNGGTLIFQMGNTPNETFGQAADARPFSLSAEISKEKLAEQTFVEPFYKETVAQPVFEDLPTHFRDKMILVSITTETPGALIFYTLDGSTPTQQSELYTGPILLEEQSALVKAIAFRDDMYKSPVASKKFVYIPHGFGIRLVHPYHPRYSAGGPLALLDGLTGSKHFDDGNWQGYLNTDLEAVIDLGRPMSLSHISMNFLRDQGAWIFLPEEVRVAVSLNGRQYTEVAYMPLDADEPVPGAAIRSLSENFEDLQARYIRVKAQNIGHTPDWHPNPGSQGTWLFIDEIRLDVKEDIQ